ncbi:hypothetical protein SpAn4DRAFT_4378 [Sporomusa ovata]|uniref:Uncharacterized protein n=1 Tax=Sporomusa ovata TaxID=2378 RepID=A0A0U1L7Z0_9FIRM|nr:hypothetical protein SpAn4DRAFT_4378 [Sporomusa ovata]
MKKIWNILQVILQIDIVGIFNRYIGILKLNKNKGLVLCQEKVQLKCGI